MKRFLRVFLFLLVSTGAAVAAPTVPKCVSDVLSMDRSDIADAPFCTLRVQVSFVTRWVEESFLATDPYDPDGPAIFVTNHSGLPGPEVLRHLSVGDVLEIVGRPAAFQLEPGIDAREVRLVEHATLPPPRKRSVLSIRSGVCNNRRVTVSGVVVGQRVERNEKAHLSVIDLASEDGSITVRCRDEIAGLDRLRDAEISVEGVVLPEFNPRAEFIGAEIELFGAESLHIDRPAPEDPFQVPECDAVGLLAWSPNGQALHARRLSGEVTCADHSLGAFVIQRGLSAVQVFTTGALPSVGASVEAAGFAERRGACGVLANAVWRERETTGERVQPYPLSLADNTEFDVGGYYGDNDIYLRLVEVTGRVKDVIRMNVEMVRLFLDVDGRSVTVDVPYGSIDFSRYQDRPILRVCGVLDTHLGRNRTLGRMFVFDDFTILPRSADDVRLVPDWSWFGRRFVRYGQTFLLFLLLPLAGFAAYLVLRRQRERERAQAITADRRRIAGELHDSISQHISGAKLWVFAAKTAAGERLPPPAAEALSMAANVLEATRMEIRNAIMDLQSDEFLSDSPTAMLQRFARVSDVVGRVRVRTALRGLPADLPVGEKRDLLALVQEAFSNAVRHGRAKNVILVCEGDGTAFELSVLNDGEPFDIASAPGPEAWHFGLSNMRERAVRAKLALTFEEMRGYRAVRLVRRRGA